MHRCLSVLLVLAACSGKPTVKEPLPPLPEPSQGSAEEAKKEEAPPPAEKEPPVPQGPVLVTLSSAKPTVKLVSAGKGAKKILKLTPKVGAKQAIEMALDFTGTQDAPADLGGKKDEIAPTVVLAGELEAKEVAADGQTAFQITINGVDAKDVAGAKIPGADFKQEISSLAGATIAGSVGANGTASDLIMRVEKPDAKTQGAMDLVKVALLPLWPVLPSEAIGVGAKWTVSTTQKIVDQFEVTKVVSYELVARNGRNSMIKGVTKIIGSDQMMQSPGGPPAKISSIAGGGNGEVTVIDGVLLTPITHTQTVDFTITMLIQAHDNVPAQEVTLKFHLAQANSASVRL